MHVAALRSRLPHERAYYETAGMVCGSILCPAGTFCYSNSSGGQSGAVKGGSTFVRELRLEGCFYLSFAMMLTWSNHEVSYITGVQSRYLLPIRPLMLLF